jgi:hypothetical protein
MVQIVPLVVEVLNKMSAVKVQRRVTITSLLKNTEVSWLASAAITFSVRSVLHGSYIDVQTDRHGTKWHCEALSLVRIVVSFPHANICLQSAEVFTLNTENGGMLGFFNQQVAQTRSIWSVYLPDLLSWFAYHTCKLQPNSFEMSLCSLTLLRFLNILQNYIHCVARHKKNLEDVIRETGDDVIYRVSHKWHNPNFKGKESLC